MTFADEERFWEKVDRSGGPNACWPWTAGTFSTGYGTFKLGGRMQLAHRVVYDQMIGPIPAGLHVLHRCDNPRCVNPAHLFLGTNADNVADRNAKGRQARGAKLRAVAGRLKTSPHASQYPGVRWHKATQKWEAYIRVAGRKLHLGLFVEEADAADAHLRAAERDERGESPR